MGVGLGRGRNGGQLLVSTQNRSCNLDSLALVQSGRITFLLLVIHCVSRLFECSQHLGVLCVRLVSWFVSLCAGATLLLPTWMTHWKPFAT